MATYDEYKLQIDRLIAPYVNGGIKVSGKENAKKIKSDLTAIQKELRNIRKLISVEIQEARVDHKVRSLKAPRGWLGIFGGKSGAALAKKNSGLKRDIEILPLQNLQQFIDKLIVDFDRSKVNLDGILKEK